ncbi:MAG: acyltransferase [Chloroflexota bacterium]
MQSQRVHFNGFDWARAFMSAAVVTWHLRTFGTSQLYTDKIAGYRINLGDILNFGIVPLSVPVFLVISCYFVARFPTDWATMRRRIGRLALLVVFWTIMLALWKGGYEQLHRLIPRSPSELIVTILSANGEYYYFFVSLILCLLVTFVFVRLSTRWNAIALALGVAATFILPQIAISARQPLLITYWSPLNFLPYPFLAIVLYRVQDWVLASGRRLAGVSLALLGAAVLVGWYEWTHYVHVIFLFGDELAFPILMRASLTFEAAAAILVALWPWRAAPAAIRFMSKHSLALFVLHAFFKPVVLQNLPLAFFPSPALARFAQTAAVIALCYVASLAAAAFIKDDLIR